MHKSKSIQLLKTFSTDELKKFDDFLNSPYFNTNHRVSKLFSELKKHHPEFISRGVDKKNLYEKLYPDKKYNEQVMKNLISELIKLEKEFLSINGFNNDPFSKSLGLINQLELRQVNTIFSKEIEVFEEMVRGGKVPSDRMYLLLHHLEEGKFTQNIVNNRQLFTSENIEKSGEYLSIYFLKNILRLSINNHINKFSFNLDIGKNFPDMLINSIDMLKLLDHMDSKNIEHTINLKLLYYALISIKNADDDISYKSYHDLLYENLTKINRDDAQRFLHFLESIIAQKINAGRREYYDDLFETYSCEIENKLYNSDENIMTVMKFRNIYLTAMRVGKYQWVENFINDFKEKLQEDNRNSIVELAFAQLNFDKKDYNKTLQHLNKIKTEQIFYKIDVKNLSLMSFYELGHFESALSLIDSFRRLLNSSPSLTEQYREKNIKFISSVTRLIKLKTDNDKNEASKMKEKISGDGLVSNKNWLFEKVEELNK